MSLANSFRHSTMASAKQAAAMGVAQRRKSAKVSPLRSAMMTPTGLPTTVALEPMLVVKTSIRM